MVADLGIARLFRTEVLHRPYRGPRAPRWLREPRRRHWQQPARVFMAIASADADRLDPPSQSLLFRRFNAISPERVESIAAPSGRRIEAQRGQFREPRPPRGIDRKRRPTIGNLAGPARAEQNRSAPVAHPRASRPGRPSLANPFCADRRSASKPARRYWGTGLCGTGIQTEERQMRRLLRRPPSKGASC